MNSKQREQRLDRILDEIVDREAEDFHREAVERRKVERQQSTVDKPEPVVPKPTKPEK